MARGGIGTSKMSLKCGKNDKNTLGFKVKRVILHICGPILQTKRTYDLESKKFFEY